MTYKITCGGCDNVWGGENRCHCSVCHVTLGGVTSWNKHRTADGTCIHPSEIVDKQGNPLLAENTAGVWVGTYGKNED